MLMIMTNISILKLDMLLRFYKFNTTLNSDNEQKARSWSFDLINRANADDSLNGFVKAFEFNLRFTGQYEDSESGYYYNWHRFYNPETGRYLTSDPISLAGGLNTYGYVGQSPYGGVDPWGLYAEAKCNGDNSIDINIPILFTGESKNFKDKISQWKNSIENAYSGKFGKFQINTKVELLDSVLNSKTYNTIDVRYEGLCTDCFNHIKRSSLMNEGVFYLSAHNNTVVHEVGHMLGISFDPYFTKPNKEAFTRWNNVMGNSVSFSNVDWLMFSVILDSHVLKWERGIKPSFETYDRKQDEADFIRKYAEQGIIYVPKK